MKRLGKERGTEGARLVLIPGRYMWVRRRPPPIINTSMTSALVVLGGGRAGVDICA